MDNGLQYFKSFLKERKLSWTKQRAAVLKMFLAKKGHISTDELYYALKKKYPRIGHSTVFRTLKLLKKASVAREVNFSGKRKRFERDLERRHHDHLVCLRCGKTTEFLDERIENLQKSIIQKYRFLPSSHRLEIFGYCRNCRKKVKT